MHHGTRLNCHCEERSDVAISQYTVGSWGNLRRNRNAFPRLHPKGTSSRFALRAPRPRWGLAMTNWEANAVGEGKRKFAAA